MINNDKNNKNELNKRELNMDELEMVTGGVEGGNGYIYDGTLDGWTETSPGSGLYTDGNGNYVSPVCQ